MAREITASAVLSLEGIMQSRGSTDEDTTKGFDQSGWVFNLWDDGVE